MCIINDDPGPFNRLDPPRHFDLKPLGIVGILSRASNNLSACPYRVHLFHLVYYSSLSPLILSCLSHIGNSMSFITHVPYIPLLFYHTHKLRIVIQDVVGTTVDIFLLYYMNS